MDTLAFISHSSKDAAIVHDIVHKLENAGIACWIAPRDIPFGSTYAASIIQGIKKSSLMIVVFTKATNDSGDVINEIEKANALKRRIIPFKMSNEEYSDSLEYYLKSKQSINAYDKPLEEAVNGLIRYINSGIQKVPVDVPPLREPIIEKEKSPVLKYLLIALFIVVALFVVFKAGKNLNNRDKQSAKIDNVRKDSGQYTSDTGKTDDTTKQNPVQGAIESKEEANDHGSKSSKTKVGNTANNNYKTYRNFALAFEAVLNDAKNNFQNLKGSPFAGTTDNYHTNIVLSDPSVTPSNIYYRNNAWAFRFVAEGASGEEDLAYQETDAMIKRALENIGIKYEKRITPFGKGDTPLDSYQYRDNTGYTVLLTRAITGNKFNQEIIIIKDNL